MAFSVQPGIDDAEAVGLAQSVGWTWTSRRTSLMRRLAQGWTARAPDGRGLGVVTCVVWDRVAWIGSLAVHPDARGQGVGRALLDAALAFARQRAPIVGLDATGAGRPLYERAGFVAVGETVRYKRAGPARAAPPLPSGEFAVYPVSSAEIMELVAYDTPCFGASRGPLLAALMADDPQRAFVAVHRKTGAFSGHALAYDGHVGMLVAESPAAAAWLLHASERAGAAPSARAVRWNPHAAALFVDAGYAPGEVCTRMVRGPLPGRAASIYALAAGWLGG